MGFIKSGSSYWNHWTRCFGIVLIFLAQGRGLSLSDLKVQCSRSGLTVHVLFDNPFQGIIYSKDHYENPSCVYVSDTNNGRKSYSFSIPLRGCGTSSQTSPSSANALSSGKSQLDVDDELFLENTIIIQEDPLIQEAGDTARRLRCVWRNNLHKAVNAKLTQIYEPAVITVQMDNKALDTIVDIQKGRGPLTNPARGFISSAPNYSSLAIYLKDPGQRFDANALNCSWTNHHGEVTPLTNDEGCIVNPHLLGPFYKSRDPKNIHLADLVLYSYFKELKLGRDFPFTITCDIEICFNRCGDRCKPWLFPPKIIH